MQITNNKFNTMPEQVQENKDNIKSILAGIKELYSTTETLTEQSETIAQSLTTVPRGTKKGFLIDAEANLFNILSVVENVVYIKYMTNVKGVQGEQGVKGDKGEKGDKGDKGDAGSGFANITDINLVVGEPNVIYDTEDGITITSQGELVTEDAQYTPTVEQNIPLIAGNGLTMDATEDGQHVDIHLSAETQTTLARSLKTPLATPTTTKIVAVDNTNSQELLGIGTGLEKINGNVQVEQSVLNDVENNKEQIDLLQGDMAGKTNVTINNVHQDYINFSSDPQTQLNNKANKDLSNVNFPIGFVYLSVSSTSPASLFGGTWEQITSNAKLILGGNAIVKTTTEDINVTGYEGLKLKNTENNSTPSGAEGVAVGSNGYLTHRNKSDVGSFVNYLAPTNLIADLSTANAVDVYIWKKIA